MITKSKIISLIAVLFIFLSLSGCSGSGQKSENGGLKIVCTIFPAYDWTREVLGEQAQNVQLTMLLANGVDMHSYQPSAADMIAIADCDLFVYVGGESDNWVKGLLSGTVNPEMRVVNMFDILGEKVKTEEITEGMESDGDGDIENDEHVWLSLKNAQTVVNAIAARLSELDGENSAVYSANAAGYCEKLSELDGQYREEVEGAEVKGLIFGDRFPFRYLTDDYGITYYAAFPGCSAETEAGFETVIFLAEKADELDVPCILTMEGAAHKIAETIVNNSKNKERPVLSLNSMQSVTLAQAQSGVTYLSAARDNLEILKTALRRK